MVFCWLAPGKFEWNFRYAVFKRISVTDGWSISCEVALIWMSLDFTDDQSTSVQVIALCSQATSHYLSQCWPRAMSPNGVTRPQWVNWISIYVSLLQSNDNHLRAILEVITQPTITEISFKISYKSPGANKLKYLTAFLSIFLKPLNAHSITDFVKALSKIFVIAFMAAILSQPHYGNT